MNMERGAFRVHVHYDAKGTKILEDIKKSFGDPITSDIKFSVQDEDICVHKSFLAMRCDYFKTMFKSGSEEDEQKVIEISQYSYNVYKAFLWYLYTEQVNLKPDEANDLLKLAEDYNEDDLKKICEKIVNCKKELTVDNAVLYADAIVFEDKELEDS